jgi:putative transcriptional regulator
MENRRNKKMSGRKIIDGLRHALEHAKGTSSVARVQKVRVPDEIDVRAIRDRLNLSQAEFAMRFGFSLRNVQNWEQRCRFPDGPARVFLKVIDRDPVAVEKALASG